MIKRVRGDIVFKTDVIFILRSIFFLLWILLGCIAGLLGFVFSGSMVGAIFAMIVLYALLFFLLVDNKKLRKKLFRLYGGSGK